MQSGTITLTDAGKTILSRRYDDKKHRKALYRQFEHYAKEQHPTGYITIIPDVKVSCNIETIAWTR